jgi:iduronate 2-sulfatase
VRQALAAKDIDGDGTDDRLVPAGIVWMQGESDALSEAVAKRYEANLKELMKRIREELAKAGKADDEIPVVIGQIADSKQDAKDGKMMDFLEVVQAAQAGFVKNDGHAALVSGTSGYKFSDPWHYDSRAYIDLGTQFADALARGTGAGAQRSKP